MKNKKYVSYVSGFVGLASLAVLIAANPAFADTTTTTPPATSSAWAGKGHGMGGMHGAMKPGVFGTVSAVNGNTITVSGKTGFGSTATATTYTVDTTNAKVTKSNAASTVANIAVGDMVMVQGTVSGTNVTATMIRDGVMRMGGKPGMNPAQMTSPITGNGQPVVAGSVTAVSGNTITITNKSNVTYTIDATNAKIVQGQNTVTISNVAVGDTVIAQGTTNGNSVVASSIIDQHGGTSTTASGTAAKPHAGFFGSIGNFFSHIFGF